MKRFLHTVSHQNLSQNIKHIIVFREIAQKHCGNMRQATGLFNQDTI